MFDVESWTDRFSMDQYRGACSEVVGDAKVELTVPPVLLIHCKEDARSSSAGRFSFHTPNILPSDTANRIHAQPLVMKIYWDQCIVPLFGSSSFDHSRPDRCLE